MAVRLEESVVMEIIFSTQSIIRLQRQGGTLKPNDSYLVRCFLFRSLACSLSVRVVSCVFFFSSVSCMS